MFKGSYQRKLLTILYSGGSNPLEIWHIQVQNGWTRRLKDDDLGCIVFEVAGTNVATAYVVSPPEPRASLAVSLPFFTMLVKNLKRYFTFEIQIIDDKKMRRRFRFSNYQSCTKVRPFTCSVPLALKPGWNQLQLNLANFTMRAYGTNYIETQRVQIHANCRVRRVYFSDRIYAEEELPKDYRILTNLRQAPTPPQLEKKSSTLLAPPPPPPAEPQVRSSITSTATKRTSKGEISVPSETIIADTSFKSTDRRPSGSDGTRSVGVASIARSVVRGTTSATGGDDPRATSFLSAVSKRSQQLSEHRTVTFEPPIPESSEEQAGEAAEERFPELIPDVQEDLVDFEPQQEPAEEIAAETVADGEVESPRMEPPESEYTESEPEYTESEPPLESDAEEIAVESAAEDESPIDNESPDESP